MHIQTYPHINTWQKIHSNSAGGLGCLASPPGQSVSPHISVLRHCYDNNVRFCCLGPLNLLPFTHRGVGAVQQTQHQQNEPAPLVNLQTQQFLQLRVRASRSLGGVAVVLLHETKRRRYANVTDGGESPPPVTGSVGAYGAAPTSMAPPANHGLVPAGHRLQLR